MLPPPSTVLASKYVRAWRTAELLAEEAGWPPPRQFRALEAEREPADALPGIRRQAGAESVAMVGHEPNLSRLASLLLSGGPDVVTFELKKGGTIVLTGPTPLQPGGAVLQAVFTPRSLRRLAR
jgi:phosphohistidine phosphatase